MKTLFYCRRTFVAALSIAALTAIGILKGIDVSLAIATVSIGLAAANSYEGSTKTYGK